MKLPAAAAFLALVALLSSGCGIRGGKVEPVEIRYWTGWTGHELDVQRELVAEFNRANPDIRVKILCIAGSYQKVPIAVAGGDTPDVCSAVWADQLYGYAARGALEPLDEWLKRDGRSPDEFMPGVRRMLTYKGRLFGLSATANSTLIAYNKSIFRDVGLDPDNPPANLEELEKAAERCTVRDSRGGYRRYGFRPGGLQIWAYVFGGGWYDVHTGKITANHPANIRALEWFQKWAHEYDIRKMESFEAGFGSVQASTGAFYTGKTAMWQTGEWAGENIERYAPGLDWGYFSLPYPPGGRASCVQLGGSVWVMPSACKNKKEAFRFLSWMCGDYASRRFCAKIVNIPPLVKAATGSEFQSDPLLRDAIKLAGGQNAFGPAQIPIWPMYLREIQRAEDKAIHSNASPKALLDQVQEDVSRQLEVSEKYSVY